MRFVSQKHKTNLVLENSDPLQNILPKTLGRSTSLEIVLKIPNYNISGGVLAVSNFTKDVLPHRVLQEI